MKLCIRYFVILQTVIIHMVIIIQYNLCCASKNHDVSELMCNVIHQHNIVDANTKQYECLSKAIININKNPPNCNYCKTYLNHPNNVKNAFKIQFQNNALNLLHMVYDKYPSNITHNTVLYVSQFGVENLLLNNNIITFGLSRRHLCNNQRVIGYNTLFHIPVLSLKQQPYSMNIGGEYWYKNLIFSLNSYYNLDNVINLNKSLYYANCLLYPQIGYQIQLKVKLPHILECYGQIKWKQFYYNKKNRIALNQLDSNQCSLSLGMQYQPIPMLEFNIDNIFMHKKYFNTLLKIALNYQFNVPISQQLRQKYYSNKPLLLPSNINTCVESFTPKYSCIPINILSKTSAITGYPGEIKLITVDDDDNQVSLQLKNTPLSYDDHGARIVHVQDNTYAIYLPKSSDNKENQVSVSYEVQNSKREIQKKQCIPLLTKDFLTAQTQDLNRQSHSNITTTHDSRFSVDKKRNNKTMIHVDPQDEVIYDDKSNDVSKACSSLEDTVYNEGNNTCIINDKNDCSDLPPPAPKLPDFSYDQSSSSYLDQASCSKTLGFDNTVNAELPTISSNVAKTDLCKKKDVNYLPIPLDINNDLSHQLHIQKNTKFASIGTPEYLKKLECSILERKKYNKITDIEKMFNKLHITLSQSSIAESTDTNDNMDNFSDSSNF